MIDDDEKVFSLKRKEKEEKKQRQQQQQCHHQIIHEDYTHTHTYAHFFDFLFRQYKRVCINHCFDLNWKHICYPVRKIFAAAAAADAVLNTAYSGEMRDE